MSNQISLGDASPGCQKVDPILVADNVSRQFGGLTAVNVAHLEIPRAKSRLSSGQTEPVKPLFSIC